MIATLTKRAPADFRKVVRRLNVVFICAVCSLWLPNPARGDDALYTDKVLPLLKERCFACHSHVARKSRGGLAVDSREALLTGGDSGPAIVPGMPDKSLLIEAVKRNGPEMPPEGKGEPLDKTEIALLEAWILEGALAPINEPANGPRKRRAGPFTDEDWNWWAVQPLRVVEPPDVASSGGTMLNGVRLNGTMLNELDRFVRARLQHEGLTAAPEATPETLLRRATFDLTGLPPTEVEVTSFVADPDFGRLVDRLLASPRFGERMARHWLDLVRYADSDGYRIDDYRPDAWRYRDYVIRAFNSDKPYDRFVQEQLAGDELFPGDPEALIATGYLRHWIYEYNSRDVPAHWSIILNDVTDTTADVFLGVGLQCARCHDHKFDPLPQRDYFRLQAFFAALLPRDDLTTATVEERAAHAAASLEWTEKTAPLQAEIAALEQPYRDKAADDAISKFPVETQVMVRKPEAERSPLEKQLVALAWRQIQYEWDRLDGRIKDADKDRLLALRRQLAKFDKLKPAPLPLALAASDVGPVAPLVMIPNQGDDPILPGVLTLLDAAPARVEALPQSPNSTGRRAALARWLTHGENPLTARVIVNRVWQQHFGRGLAVNASDFGNLGEPPTHPELLDWLAAWFMREGWSLKKLHRLVVTSATYRQSASHPQAEAGQLKDPENRLLWRWWPRRLEAEQIRDAIFAVTGELQLDPACGPGVPATEPRRSIYTRILRNTRDPLTDAFDAPLWFSSVSSRDTTTTPVQSLLLVNSPFMLERGRAFAARLEKLAPSDEAAQVEHTYRLAFGRLPTREELARAAQFLSEQRHRLERAIAGAQSTMDRRAAALADFCHALFNSSEFLYME